MFICLHFKRLFVLKLGRGLITRFGGRKRGNGEGWFKWIILQWAQKKGVEEGKYEREAEQQSMFFPPRAPWGFELSDLKWRPAEQTWMLWLHIKPFNHRAPCSTKKPLMRSLPRMNKQALMKNPEHFSSCVKDTVNKRKVGIWPADSWGSVVCFLPVARLRGYRGYKDCKISAGKAQNCQFSLKIPKDQEIRCTLWWLHVFWFFCLLILEEKGSYWTS